MEPLPGRCDRRTMHLLSRAGAVLDVLHVVPEDRGAGDTKTHAFTVPRYLDEPHHEWEAWRREFVTRFLGADGLPKSPVRVAVGEPGGMIAAPPMSGAAP